VLKAHPSHPQLSRSTGAVVVDALRAAGAPEGTFAVVTGFETGNRLVQDPRIAAAAFTGSLRGGRALYDLAVNRPVPIPFYGELGSVNPAFVTREAASARPDEVATGFVGSVSLGVGQFCTKPGLLFLPAGHGMNEDLVAAAGGVAAALAAAPSGMPVEIECASLEDVDAALAAGARHLLLDNMTTHQLRDAVRRARDDGVETEASGNVSLETIRAIAQTGVDSISVGALTHSAPALDLSLLLQSP
jgi:delta 1-pyrroline-5-carboxylate dehydrogenase